jgi:hypothetical protein
MNKIIPELILEDYCECGMCGSPTEIGRLSEIDEQTQIFIRAMCEMKDGWVIYCNACGNFYVITLTACCCAGIL